MAAQYKIENRDVTLPIVEDGLLKNTLNTLYQEYLKDPSKDSAYLCYRNNEISGFLRVHFQQPFQFWYYGLQDTNATNGLKTSLREFILTHANTPGKFEDQFKDVGLEYRRFQQHEFLQAGGEWNYQAHVATPDEIYQKLQGQTPVKAFERAPSFFSSTLTHAPTSAPTPDSEPKKKNIPS